MGDENTLPGQTKAHKHSSPAGDGGFLETGITGITNTTTGSLIYFDASSQATNLSSGSSGDVLTMGASLPAWSTPGTGGSWVEVINERDTASANGLDTGFVDLTEYRVVDLFWCAYLKTGSSAMDVRFYDPDGNVASGAVQGTAGFHNGTFYSNGNQTSLQLSFGQNLVNDRCINLGMRIVCSPVDTPSGGQTGFNYWLTQRSSYDATYITGNGCLVDGFTTSSDLMFFCGIQDQSGNTWEDAILTAYGAGDNTT
jgi:hypothetical protein